MTTLLVRALPDRPLSVYLSLIGAMIAGRLVWGVASLALYGLSGTPFTLEMFLTSAFVNAAPGIAVHIVVIPAIILALRRANLLSR